MKNETHTKTCSKCNAQFSCGSFSEANCWCSSLPNIIKVADQDCLCKSCLVVKISNMISQLLEDVEKGKVDRPDFTKYQTSELVEGIDFYVESGMYVFTQWYHLKRGHCCSSGCRHCPYQSHKH
jgi:hypothetical protein